MNHKKPTALDVFANTRYFTLTEAMAGMERVARTMYSLDYHSLTTCAGNKFIDMTPPKNAGGLIEMKNSVHRCLGKYEIHLYSEIARKAVDQNNHGWFDAVAHMYTKGAAIALLRVKAESARNYLEGMTKEQQQKVFRYIVRRIGTDKVNPNTVDDMARLLNMLMEIDPDMIENIAKAERRRMINNISSLASTRENTTQLKIHLLARVAKQLFSENTKKAKPKVMM